MGSQAGVFAGSNGTFRAAYFDRIGSIASSVVVFVGFILARNCMDSRTASWVLSGMDVGIVVDIFFLTTTVFAVQVVRLGSIFLVVVRRHIAIISHVTSSLVAIMVWTASCGIAILGSSTTTFYAIFVWHMGRVWRAPNVAFVCNLTVGIFLDCSVV